MHSAIVPLCVLLSLISSDTHALPPKNTDAAIPRTLEYRFDRHTGDPSCEELIIKASLNMRAAIKDDGAVLAMVDFIYERDPSSTYPIFVAKRQSSFTANAGKRVSGDRDAFEASSIFSTTGRLWFSHKVSMLATKAIFGFDGRIRGLKFDCFENFMEFMEKENGAEIFHAYGMDSLSISLIPVVFHGNERAPYENALQKALGLKGLRNFVLTHENQGGDHIPLTPARVVEVLLEHPEFLANLNHLGMRGLYLEDTNLSGLVSALSQSPNLRSLDFSHSDLWVRDLAGLDRFTGLKSLALGWVDIMAPLNLMRVTGMNRTQIDDALVMVAALPGLENLEVHGIPLSAERIAVLPASLKSLKVGVVNSLDLFPVLAKQLPRLESFNVTSRALSVHQIYPYFKDHPGFTVVLGWE